VDERVRERVEEKRVDGEGRLVSYIFFVRCTNKLSICEVVISISVLPKKVHLGEFLEVFLFKIEE